MRFLADEDFPTPSVAKLRAVGHDMAAVTVIGRGSIRQRALLRL